MDWPGAQEMAKRFAKIIDPKIMADSDESPEMQQAKQQMEAMAQELNQLHEMMQNVGKSIEMQDLDRKEFEAQIKAFDAETKRISAVQAGMTEQQIQDIAMGVVSAAMESNNLMSEMPSREQNESMEMQGMQGMPPEMMQQGMPPPEMMPPEMMPPPEGMEQ
jgi:predicted RNase H-like nuclease (RuvC/YqgF family)